MAKKSKKEAKSKKKAVKKKPIKKATAVKPKKKAKAVKPGKPRSKAVQAPKDTVIAGKEILKASIVTLKKEIQTLIVKKINMVTIDCKNVKEIDAYGIGLLIQAQNSLSDRGGRLVLINASEETADMLRILHLDPIMEL
ncbi:STAS domain-containing protein [Spirochaetota bacterium]